ncbi:hypothetical protein D039_3855A, partial [Vibrio parahaemolyticus EKP-028]
MKKEEGG